MTGRIEGAQLCHRIDAAKQLVKYGSKDAAEFIAKYKGLPCGHSINGRPNQADPCPAEDRSLVTVTLNAPPTLTRDFLTVLSGIDEFLMARLIRAQTAHGDTIIEFLDDVMQDRTDGFKTHHRIAAAKELIVHIVRDEQPDPVPGNDSQGAEARNSDEPAHTTVVPAKSLPRTRYGAGTQGGGGGRSTAANPPRTEPILSTTEGPAHPEPSSTVIPAKSLPRTRYGAGIQRGGGRSTAANPARTEPVLSTAEGRQDYEERKPRKRRTRTQRHRDGNAKAAILRQGSERNKDEKPAPAKLTPTERRIKEKLNQHWHEPDPYGAPIDSTHPGRSPPS